MKKNLAEQSYWDSGYSDYQLQETGDDDIIKIWLKENVPPTNSGTCFEIGCFPGRYLTVLGRLGYELNGIDLTPRIETDFSLWLKNNNFKVGTFERANFLEYSSEKKYTVVCSFGFIEHFVQWEEVLVKHLSLVEKNGYVVVSTPNFRGWAQRLIHYYLDRENYERHYIQSMKPLQWAKICEQHGFKVIKAGYIGEFQFWVDKQPTGFFTKRIFEKLIKLTPRLKKMKPGKAAYSPFCGVIAQRIK